MAVDRAAAGLVEPGQRERGAQLEAAGLLLLRDGDGGEEGGFGGGGIGGVLFEEDFAARAVEFGVEPTLPRALGIGERSIECRQGGVDLAGFRFRLGQAGRDERIEDDDLRSRRNATP